MTKSTSRRQRCRRADVAARNPPRKSRQTCLFAWHTSCSYKGNPAHRAWTDKQGDENEKTRNRRRQPDVRRHRASRAADGNWSRDDPDRREEEGCRQVGHALRQLRPRKRRRRRPVTEQPNSKEARSRTGPLCLQTLKNLPPV